MLWPIVDLKALTSEDRFVEELRQKDNQFRGMAILDLGCHAETDTPPARAAEHAEHNVEAGTRLRK